MEAGDAVEALKEAGFDDDCVVNDVVVGVI
jgi:hypothetical protein